MLNDHTPYKKRRRNGTERTMMNDVSMTSLIS